MEKAIRLYFSNHFNMEGIFMYFYFLFVNLFLLTLLGCKSVEIKGGHIPQEYLQQASEFEGTYEGFFNNKNAEIKLYIQGDQPRLLYSDADGTDIIRMQCHSHIGLLKTIFFENRNGSDSLERLEFEFDPGNCKNIQGRRLILRYISQNKFEVRILSHSELEDECDPRFPPPREGDNCGRIEVSKYLEGKFVKRHYYKMSRFDLISLPLRK